MPPYWYLIQSFVIVEYYYCTGFKVCVGKYLSLKKSQQAVFKTATVLFWYVHFKM